MSSISKLQGDGDFEMEVRGESYYQDALAHAARGRKEVGDPVHVRARLIREHDNVHDSNAIRVEIGGRTVGRIPREFAPGVRRAADKRGLNDVIECPAEIRGGFEARGETYQFGVWLDLPDDFIDDAVQSEAASATVYNQSNEGCSPGCLGAFILVVAFVAIIILTNVFG